MNIYQVSRMPERKEKGSHDKWIDDDPVEAKSRKEVARELHKTEKSGSWRIRQI